MPFVRWWATALASSSSIHRTTPAEGSTAGPELEAIAALAIEHDLIVIMDEVYDRLVFEGEHVYMASLPGMAERTISLRSLGKTFSLTGWKIGWAIAPPNLTNGIRAAHQFFTYAVSTPLQHGTVAALKAPASYFEEFIAGYRARRDRLCDALDDVGFTVFRRKEPTSFLQITPTSDLKMMSPSAGT